MNSPYYHFKTPDGRWLVPRDPIENVKWRIRCRERALVDKKFQDVLWQACMDDVLFFMAFACWSFEPRAKIKIRPFVPWPHQESVFVAMDEAVDRAEREEIAIDVIVDKSRAQGGTFGYLWVDLRRWLRDPMFSAGYVTRNEDLVDSKTDSNTVLWKIAWAIERLPSWMRPEYERNLGQHSFINKENGALLRGYAAGQDVAAGGRATVFTIDEAGARDFVAAGKDEAVQEALHDVTNCCAASTYVVTDHGLRTIDSVELFHRVWDGTMWVSHEGSIYRGEQETISAYGIRLTPDHRVLTTKGWRNASDKGFDREEVRLPDGYWDEWPNDAWQGGMAMQVSMRQESHSQREPTSTRSNEKLRLLSPRVCKSESNQAWNAVDADVLLMAQHDSTLHQSKEPSLPRLWRAWNCCLRPMEKVRSLFGGHGGEARRKNTGTAGQQHRIFSWKLLLGNGLGTGGEQAEQRNDRNFVWEADSRSVGDGNGIEISDNSRSYKEGLDGRQSSEAVYDLLNCGPRQRFTVIDSHGIPVILHNCIRMVSARYVDQGVFHEACENPDSAQNGVHLVLDWKDNPIHGKHSYIVRDGKPEAVKPEDQEIVDKYHAENPTLRDRLERKGFKYEGRVRSPWYDMRCLRPTSTPRLIASQLDRSPREAVGKVFPSDLLDRMKREHCKPPVWQGTPVFDSESLKLTGLIPRDDGALKLWFRPGIDNTPPPGPFTAGCDIASGGVTQFASNSVMSALDDRTGEQVLEYAVKGLEPRPFARRVVGLCMWLRNALLGWEDSGVSGGFAKEVMEVLYYGNVFFRDVTQLGSQKKSRKPGWPCRDADKADMFEQMALAMEMGRYTPRSDDMVMECGEYEWDGDKIIHAPTKNRGATDKNHADRAVAGGGSWLVYSTDNVGERIDTGDEIGTIPEYGSFLWREQQERNQVKMGSPRFGIRDVIGY